MNVLGDESLHVSSGALRGHKHQIPIRLASQVVVADPVFHPGC